MRCVNISHPDFRNLLDGSGLELVVLRAKVGLWMDKNDNFEEFPTLTELGINPSRITADLKIINVLPTLQRNVFSKDKIQGWLNDLQKKGVSAAQLEMFREVAEPGMTKDDITVAIAAKNSFAVEVNTAKENKETPYTFYKKIGEKYVVFNVADEQLDSFDNKEDAIKKVKEYNYLNTQHYSNLTVPGGINYTENEIATPEITPNIKGHAQFSTDQGIGWFRSDEFAAIVEKEDALNEKGNVDHNNFTVKDTGKGGYVYLSKKSSKTRRILELQSDLFQKGRDKKDLIKTTRKTDNLYTYDGYVYKNMSGRYLKIKEGGGQFGTTIDITKEEYERNEPQSYNEITASKENQFLQLLNKKNNWVNFFIKSIIQDSTKKGYEKVLFPSGNTASKVEGHTTLEEFKKQKEDKIAKLEKELKKSAKDRNSENWFSLIYKIEDGRIKKIDSDSNAFTDTDVKTEEEAKEIVLRKLGGRPDDSYTRETKNNEIVQLKQELKKVETEGFGALKPIYNFYENRVTNALKKQGYNPVKVTDEYGNTWNEVTIEKERDKATIFYQVNLAKMYKDQAKRLYFDKINGKNLTDSDIQRINGDLKRMSDNAGDVQWTLRQARSGKYYIAGYKNGAVTMDDYYSPYAGGMFRQLKSKSQEIKIENLDIKLTNWAKKNGIPIESLKSVMEKFPGRYENSALGIADFAKGLIAVADNRNIDTLAEEVAHFAIEMMLTKDQNMQAALDQVVETETYKEVLEEYGEIYENEIDFKKEALGKILAAEIVNQFKTTETLSSNPGFWQTFKNAVINFFNKIQEILGINRPGRTTLEKTIIPLAESILNEEKLDTFKAINGYSQAEILYEINKQKEEISNIPLLSTTEELIKRKEKIYNNILSKLNARIKTFERTSAKSKRQINTLKNNIKELTRLKDIGEIDLGISKFALQAQEELERVNTLMNDVANGNSFMTAINLVTAHDFMLMYDSLFRDINDNLIQKGVEPEIREQLLAHTGKVHSLISNGLASSQVLLNSLAIKVLEKSNIDYNGEIIDKDFDAREIIEATYGDMSTWRLQVGNYKYADSGIIRTVAKILFNAKSNVDRFVKRLFNSLVGSQQAFLTKYKQTDLVETNSEGKPTHYFARELNYSRYYESQQKLRNELAKKLNIKNPETEEFDYKYIDVTRLSPEDRKIYNEAWADWRKNNSTTVTIYDDEGNIEGTRTIPNNSYKNKEFIKRMKDPLYKNYYNAIIKAKTEAVDKLPVNYRTERLIYMVPSIYKSTLERITKKSQNDSFLTKIGKVGRDAFFVEADDTQFGQLNALNNRVIPIFFTGEVANLEDLSYDILKSVSLFAEMAENFSQMNSIAGELGAIQKSLAVRQYKTKGRGQDKEGIESKEYQALENLINTQLYNIEREQLEYTFEESNLLRKGVLKATGGKIDLKDKSMSWTKVSQKIATFIRDNNLAFNLITSTVGWLKGSADSIIEDQIGIYSTNESKNFARKEFLKELGTVIADIGSVKQRSKMHLLLQEAQIVKLDTMLHETDSNRLTRKVLNRDILYTTFASGDYGMKGRITLSIYDNYRLYNGKFMTKARFLRATSIEQRVKNDGVHAKKMSKEWEALREKSLYNAYEAVDGQLKIKKEFKEFVTEGVLNSAKGKIEHVSTQVDGVMSPTDKGKLARTILGDFIFMHRGWFINMVDSKFKRGTVNYLSEEEEIGHYRAMGGYLRNVLKNIIGQGNTETTGAFAVWKELSPAKKRGVRKTIADTVFLTIATVLAGIANKLADDDPENMTNQYLGYVLNRLLLEQSAGFNMASTVEIIDEPVVGARILKESVSILDSYSGETYEKGMYEDWTHRGKYWFRKTPLKNLYELQYPDEKNKFIKTVVNNGYYDYLTDEESIGITGWLLGQLVPYYGTSWDQYTNSQKRENVLEAINNLEQDQEVDNGFN